MNSTSALYKSILSSSHCFEVRVDIDTLYGYFTGAAQFSSVLAGSVAINGHYLGLETVTVEGVNRKLVTWN